MGTYNKTYDKASPALWGSGSNRQGGLPFQEDLIAYYRGNIQGTNLVCSYPISYSATPQVKGSAFTGAGTGASTGLLTTDTITSSGTTPTCTVDGTLTISADCWDIEVHRAGTLWAYWPGINVGGAFELDASGLGHHLYLTTTGIVEAVDGSGTNWCNEMGFTVADGSQSLEVGSLDVIGPGWRIPALTDGSGCASWSFTDEELLGSEDIAVFNTMLASNMVDSVGASSRPVQLLQSGYFNGTSDHVPLTIPPSELIGDIVLQASFKIANVSTGPLIVSIRTLQSLSLRIMTNGVLAFYRATAEGSNLVYCPTYIYTANDIVNVRVEFVKATGQVTFTVSTFDALGQPVSTTEYSGGVINNYASAYPITNIAGSIGRLGSSNLWAEGYIWDVNINDKYFYSFPTLSHVGSAVWHDRGTKQLDAIATVATPASHISSNIFFGNNTLDQDGYSERNAENLLPVSEPRSIFEVNGYSNIDSVSNGIVSVDGGLTNFCYIYTLDNLSGQEVTFTLDMRCADHREPVVGDSYDANVDLKLRVDGVSLLTVDSITSLGDGWYRLSKTVTATGVVGSGYGFFRYVDMRDMPAEFTNWHLTVNGGNYVRTTGFPVKKERAPKRIATRHTGTGVIVCVGDSITVYGGVGYPGYLWGLLPSASNVVNAGIGGNTTDLVLERLQPDVLSFSPSVVTMIVGINDVKNDREYSRVRDNIEEIIDTTLATGALFVIGTITPFKGHALWTEQRQIDLEAHNQWIHTTYDANPSVAVVDMYDALEDPSNPQYLLPAYDSGDTIHPSMAGAMYIANLFEQALPSPRGAVDTNNELILDSGRVKYSLLDPPQWPSVLDIIEVTGVDNAVYNADGTGKEFATQALALAAMVSLADGSQLIGGVSGAGLWKRVLAASEISRAGIDFD